MYGYIGATTVTKRCRSSHYGHILHHGESLLSEKKRKKELRKKIPGCPGDLSCFHSATGSIHILVWPKVWRNFHYTQKIN